MSNESSTEYDVTQRVNVIRPSNYGWLEYELNNKELDHVWKCIENKGINVNEHLAGNIDGSYVLKDTNNFFWENTLIPLMKLYSSNFRNLGQNVPVFGRHPYSLSSWWVNYQKQHEFNPAHRHTGVYSFVIWLKIPIEFEDQNKDNITNTPLRSAFQFNFTDLLGRLNSYTFRLGKKFEGKMLFFPSRLPHAVFPFYNCKKDRISISGNIIMRRKNDAL